MKDLDFMSAALEAAAKDPLEIPVGAVIVRDGTIVASAHNQQIARNDALAHAELLAIASAQKALGTKQLKGCGMYVTLEPCPMCAGAIILSGLERCVFAAFDKQYGCCGSVYALPMDPVFHHHTDCQGGIMQEEAEAMLETFFRGIRNR